MIKNYVSLQQRVKMNSIQLLFACGLIVISFSHPAVPDSGNKATVNKIWIPSSRLGYGSRIAIAKIRPFLKHKGFMIIY